MTFKMRHDDADNLSRDTEFSESGITHIVSESGKRYSFTYEQIQAAAFSDEAAVLYFKGNAVAISADGVEGGKYPLLRSFLEDKTAKRTRKTKRNRFLRSLPLTAAALVLSVIFSVIIFAQDFTSVKDPSETGALYSVREYVLNRENAREITLGYCCYYSESGIAVVYMGSNAAGLPLYYANYGTDGWQVKKMSAPCCTIELESGETIRTYQTDSGIFAEVCNCPNQQMIKESPEDEAKTTFQPSTGYGYFFRIPENADYCLTVSGQPLSGTYLKSLPAEEESGIIR